MLHTDTHNSLIYSIITIKFVNKGLYYAYKAVIFRTLFLSLNHTGFMFIRVGLFYKYNICHQMLLFKIFVSKYE